jgi:hypothetical protein
MLASTDSNGCTKLLAFASLQQFATLSVSSKQNRIGHEEVKWGTEKHGGFSIN